VQIKRIGEKQREENSRFRAWLKRHNFAERSLKTLAHGIEEAIDCTTCANCCRVATTKINQRDVDRLTRFMGVKAKQFLADYTVETLDEGLVLKRTSEGCVFLAGNLCSVYEGRPETCQHFPHLVKGHGSFLSRMWQMPDRAVYCPIVFNSLEAFKKETGFKK
jgi:hypothetical protein